MRTPTAPAVLLAIVLAACSPDGAGNPVAPSAPSLSASGAVATATATHGTATVIRGTLDASEVSTPFPAPPAIPTRLETRLTGTGHASHLGRYTVVANFTVDLATAAGSGIITFTAANGDSFTASATGQAVFMTGFVQITEIATITGGTGRFAHATGTLTIVRQYNPATGASSGTVDGTINLTK